GCRCGGPESAAILDGITFEVPAGKRVAIVGRSGSGKTTLVKCLAGLLEPTEGTIFYDGVDLKTLNYRDLRRQIGFILQDNHLFNDTIAQNIAFGEAEPDMDQVLWAARVANAHEFVERLPLGYDTRIGESGSPSPAASGSASPSRGPSTGALPSWSSTRRPVRSTRSPSAPSRRISINSWRDGRPSSSPTARSRMPTSSWCSRRAGWKSSAPTTS